MNNCNLICLTTLVLAAVITSCGFEKKDSRPSLSREITPADLKTHISFLAGDELGGRESGTAGAAKAATYIANRFDEFGLNPAGESSGKSYFQEFTVDMSILNNPHRPDSLRFPAEKRIARNVIGKITGSAQPESCIILGAHYDHLGSGMFGSLYDGKEKGPKIHNGADDNASGTAGLLELAHYFGEHPPEKSILFIAFSGEEMGLLGSRHFVEHPTVPLGNVTAMINMDMIGRLQDNSLLVFGTGSSDGWDDLLTRANTDSLILDTIPDGTGASDHTSFYNKEIPVLHYFTDTHADYHRPSDDSEFINFEGESRVLKHIRQLVTAIDSLDAGSLAYTEAPETQNRNVTLDGITLGVTPDYGFNGPGMRITGVHGNGPAGKAGLVGGDVIIKLDGKELKDIYEYMEVLHDLKKGESSTVTVWRDGEKRTFDIVL